MKQLFKSELDGTILFKKVIMFLLAYIVCIAGMGMMLSQGFYLGYFLVLILLLVSAFALQFQFLSALINVVSLDDKKFEFIGEFSAFMGVCIKGLLLSMITFGIYGPWFERNIINYITENTTYPDKTLRFNGKAGKLLKYMILSMVIPALILGIILGIGFSSIMIADPYATNTYGQMALFFIIYVVGVFTISSIYTYYIYKWYVNFTFGEQDITLKATAVNSILFILGQLLLTIVTFGIYGFAAEVKIFKYFTENTILTDTTTGEITPVYFVGETGKGFGLLLGQTLLSIVTLGIYIPWAYANIQNWFINNIELGD